MPAASSPAGDAIPVLPVDSRRGTPLLVGFWEKMPYLCLTAFFVHVSRLYSPAVHWFYTGIRRTEATLLQTLQTCLIFHLAVGLGIYHGLGLSSKAAPSSAIRGDGGPQHQSFARGEVHATSPWFAAWDKWLSFQSFEIFLEKSQELK